jgi:predicted negative regulator of RcsB-dependent stress response
MKTLFGVIVLLLVGIAALGFYRGWFHLSTNSTDHNSSATFTVDQKKLQADEGKARDKLEELGQKAKEKTAVPADKVEPHAGQP